MVKTLKKAAVLVACISMLSCVQLDQEQQRAALLTELDGSLAQLQVNLRQLERRMDQLTEDKQCQRDSECRVLAKGVRPCGGAEQFIAYSVLTTDEEFLLATSEKFSQLRQRQHQRLGTISSCEVLDEPVASCQQNSCTVQPLEYARR
ncbi:MAG: hypothetical protein LAT66_10620 [Alkalimonas sp.]|nr:hypothetical protein [Alkalimonas sp.]